MTGVPFVIGAPFVVLACASVHGPPAPIAPAPARATLADVAAAREATTTAPTVVVADATAAEEPTWTAIYGRYFGPHTEGDCGRSRVCHAETVTDAASAYRWLSERGYIAGKESPLVSTVNSCLRWFGGNMPPRGKANDGAVRALRLWTAAGAQNN